VELMALLKFAPSDPIQLFISVLVLFQALWFQLLTYHSLSLPFPGLLRYVNRAKYSHCNLPASSNYHPLRGRWRTANATGVRRIITSEYNNNWVQMSPKNGVNEATPVVISYSSYIDLDASLFLFIFSGKSA
jgi:hypothetical protein